MLDDGIYGAGCPCARAAAYLQQSAEDARGYADCRLLDGGWSAVHATGCILSHRYSREWLSPR